MAKRIGAAEMFRIMNRSSAADVALISDPELAPLIITNSELIAGKDTDVSQAFTMELLQTEADWSHLMIRARSVPTSFINGGDDPATGIATMAEYRETYPWIEIEVIPDAGKLPIYQHYETVIPKLAEAAVRAQSDPTQASPP